MDVIRRLEGAQRHAGAATGTWLATHGAEMVCTNPATGATLASILAASRDDYDAVIDKASEQFRAWRLRPAPSRGLVVRRLGELFREHKEELGRIVSLEVGKIKSEGLGEVQEVIDICDFAVGLSRQLYGLTLASERPEHRMFEQWHPLGPIGVITAFNFPMAVWAWNAAIAAVCGDPVVWKPSPHGSLSSLAVQELCNTVMKEHDCDGVFNLLAGEHDVGEWMVDDRRLPLVSFTGSIPVGRLVATRVSSRLGRTLLELGGNNAIIVLDDADLDLAVRAITFGAVGTAGQRCTTTRRLFLQKGIAPRVLDRLARAFRTVTIGDPLDPKTLMGPLINARAVESFTKAVEHARAQGGRILFGGGRPKLAGPLAGGYFVEPTLVAAPSPEQFPIASEETFASLLYAFEVASLDEALAHHNAVSQGLSSAIFTNDLRASERFLSAAGSDCGIANVNIGTSGAEIGGAFGGEKETGGGREAGSDSWKAYMRRQTCTVNYGRALPLAQGVEFPAG